MKRGMKVLSALAAVVAVASAPTWAICPFSSPIVHGGDFQGSIPGSILSEATAVGGVWWEVGFGNQTVGAGNDSGSVSDTGLPAADRIWIARDRRGTSGIAMTYDWTNPGVDNCLSSNIAGTGRMAAYLVDNGGNYALVGVAGKLAPVGHHDFDDVDTGMGPFGNDIPMEPLPLKPAINLDLGTLTDTTVVGDVLPARASINCFDDGSGVCSDPTTAVVDATALTAGMGGAAVPGCTAAGCNGVTFNRGTEYCWNQGARIAGNVVAGPAGCSLLPALACTPGPAGDAFCAGFTFGVCVSGPPTVNAVGPALPAGCTLIAAAGLSDVAINARSEKAQGNVIFTFEAASFNTSHFNVVGTSRGNQVLNDGPIFAKSNDGSLQTYEVAISSGKVRFNKSFVIQTVLNDGTVKETPVE